ncbi:hypothetical protein D3C81_1532110 [compost metagenome]
MVRVLQAVLVQHVVERRQQAGVHERFHLRRRVHDRDVRNFFGCGLRFELDFLLVGIQRVEFDMDVGMRRFVLFNQRMDRFIGRSSRVWINVLERDSDLLAAAPALRPVSGRLVRRCIVLRRVASACRQAQRQHGG